jgi:hypothetical protein
MVKKKMEMRDTEEQKKITVSTGSFAPEFFHHEGSTSFTIIFTSGISIVQFGA